MARAPVPEAKLVKTEAGIKPEAAEGWFVVNLEDAMGTGIDEGLYDFRFEGPSRAFPHFGINVSVLGPGGPGDVPRRSRAGGVPGARRRMRADRRGAGASVAPVDFVHCPPQTAHVIVGAGDASCAVLMVGARNAGEDLIYPVSPAAAGYGASVEEETEEPERAYAGWTRPGPGASLAPGLERPEQDSNLSEPGGRRPEGRSCEGPDAPSRIRTCGLLLRRKFHSEKLSETCLILPANGSRIVGKLHWVSPRFGILMLEDVRSERV